MKILSIVSAVVLLTTAHASDITIQECKTDVARSMTQALFAKALSDTSSFAERLRYLNEKFAECGTIKLCRAKVAAKMTKLTLEAQFSDTASRAGLAEYNACESDECYISKARNMESLYANGDLWVKWQACLVRSTSGYKWDEACLDTVAAEIIHQRYVTSNSSTDLELAWDACSQSANL